MPVLKSSDGAIPRSGYFALDTTNKILTVSKYDFNNEDNGGFITVCSNPVVISVYPINYESNYELNIIFDATPVTSTSDSYSLAYDSLDELNGPLPVGVNFRFDIAGAASAGQLISLGDLKNVESSVNTATSGHALTYDETSSTWKNHFKTDGCIPYKFDDTQTSSPVPSEFIRLNNSDPSLATQVFISFFDGNNIDVLNSQLGFYTQLDNFFRISVPTQGEITHLYKIVGSSTDVGNSQIVVDVVYNGGAGSVSGTKHVILCREPPFKIDDLRDVNFPTPLANDEVLKFNIATAKWENKVDAGGLTPSTTVTSVQPTSGVGTSLNYAREDHVHDIVSADVIQDVEYVKVADQQILVRGAHTTGLWGNGFIRLNGATDGQPDTVGPVDVNISTPANDQLLVYQGGQWVNQAPPLALPTGTNNQTLRYNTVTGTWQASSAIELDELNSKVTIPAGYIIDPPDALQLNPVGTLPAQATVPADTIWLDTSGDTDERLKLGTETIITDTNFPEKFPISDLSDVDTELQVSPTPDIQAKDSGLTGVSPNITWQPLTVLGGTTNQTGSAVITDPIIASNKYLNVPIGSHYGYDLGQTFNNQTGATYCFCTTDWQADNVGSDFTLMLSENGTGTIGGGNKFLVFTTTANQISVGNSAVINQTISYPALGTLSWDDRAVGADWHSVVVTVNANNIIVYIDGVPSGINYTDAGFGQNSAIRYLYLSVSAPPAQQSKSQWSEIFAYDVALSAGQVTGVHNYINTKFNVSGVAPKNSDSLLYFSPNWVPRTSNDGQVKVNGSGGVNPTFIGLTTPPQAVNYGVAALDVSSFPTTSNPLNAGTFVDSQFWDSGNLTIQENQVGGQINIWRIICNYSNKQAGNSGVLTWIIRNTLSGFVAKGSIPLPSGLTAENDRYTEIITIADGASLKSPLGTGIGYRFEVESSTSIDVVLSSLTRINPNYTPRS